MVLLDYPQTSPVVVKGADRSWGGDHTPEKNQNHNKPKPVPMWKSQNWKYWYVQIETKRIKTGSAMFFILLLHCIQSLSTGFLHARLMNIAEHMKKEWCQKNVFPSVTRECMVRNYFSPVINWLSLPSSFDLGYFMLNITSIFFFCLFISCGKCTWA